MKTVTMSTAAAICLLTVLTHPARAQHEGHAAGPPPGGAEVGRCAKAQPVVDQILTSAMARLEAARQTNSPPQLRAAIDDLQGALRDVRVQLAPCAQLAASPPAPQGAAKDGPPAAAVQPARKPKS